MKDFFRFAVLLVYGVNTTDEHTFLIEILVFFLSTTKV